MKIDRLKALQPTLGNDGAKLHVRRNLPLYVAMAITVGVVAVAPTRQPGGSGALAAGGPIGAGEPGEVSLGDGAVGIGPDGASLDPEAAAVGSSGSTGRSASGQAGAVGTSGGTAGVLKTRGGFDCAPGVRQLPWSAYAAPCRPKWSGNNGGATYPGVGAEKIKIVIRSYADNADAQAQRVVLERAGGATEPGAFQKMFDAFVAYFNEAFELYGRKVEFELYTSAANQFDEVNGSGRELACADATRIKEELGAFMTLSGTGIMYGPYAECAVERKMVLPLGPYAFPEEWYAARHPYAWAIPMNCNRSTILYTQYITNRLKGGKAIWAGDPGYKTSNRVYGAIGPDIAAYSDCSKLFDREMAKNNIDIKSRYTYVLDPARLQVQATQAVVQFKAAGVTTLFAAADFLTMISLTQAAKDQEWYPEWILQGSGLQDNNSYARLYNQDVADGHMFGQSVQGDTDVLNGPQGEAADTYKRITGQPAPGGTNGWYYELLQIFNMIQQAGPSLSPPSIGTGMAQLPDAGLPKVQFGYWSFRNASDGTPGVLDHSAIEDIREVYWDGKKGKFVATYNGRRFRVGEWPREAPPIYPDRK